jgi:hypothetical protein
MCFLGAGVCVAQALPGCWPACLPGGAAALGLALVQATSWSSDGSRLPLGAARCLRCRLPAGAVGGADGGRLRAVHGAHPAAGRAGCGVLRARHPGHQPHLGECLCWFYGCLCGGVWRSVGMLDTSLTWVGAGGGGGWGRPGHSTWLGRPGGPGPGCSWAAWLRAIVRPQVSNGVVGSQAFEAHNEGFDVWLGNSRCNPPHTSRGEPGYVAQPSPPNGWHPQATPGRPAGPVRLRVVAIALCCTRW